MKNLILIALISITFIGNTQVLVIDIQQPITSIEVKHQEELQYGDLHEDNIRFDLGLFQIYFEESQTYDVVINRKYYLTFKARFIDDVLIDLDEVEVICNCSYEVQNNKLVLHF